jgi:hypothetical protein
VTPRADLLPITVPMLRNSVGITASLVLIRLCGENNDRFHRLVTSVSGLDLGYTGLVAADTLPILWRRERLAVAIQKRVPINAGGNATYTNQPRGNESGTCFAEGFVVPDCGELRDLMVAEFQYWSRVLVQTTAQECVVPMCCQAQRGF